MARLLTYTIKAGGVEEAISSSFDAETVFEREKTRAFIRIGRELEVMGLLTVAPLPQSGDYRRRLITLNLNAEPNVDWLAAQTTTDFWATG